MEEEVAETEYCSNCRRDIPAANFVMHVTHCQRNLTLCKKCGEPVPTSQQEEHFEENHVEVKCECGQLLEKMNLEEHKENTCPNRLADCQYCEIQLQFSELTSHVEYCGSRTEKCDLCNRFIQKKDFDEHMNTGCQYPVKEEKKKLSSKMPGDSYSEMPLDMLHAMGLMGSTGGHLDMERFPPFISAGMREFEQILNTGMGIPPFGRASYFGDVDGPDATRMDDREVIPRGARGNSGFPKSKFDQHSFQDFENVDSDDTAQQIDDDEMLAAVYQANEIDSTTGNGVLSGMVDDPFPNVESSQMSDFESDTTKLPCEFCGSLLPMDALILHQSGCQLKSLDSFPANAFRVPLVDSQYGEFHENETESESEDTEGLVDVTFLPCEFCQELFPCDNLIVHQAICDVGPTSLLTPIVHNGSGPEPPLNNARPHFRNGAKTRPSRPVYESKKIQKSIESFIPSELDESPSDLDFTPKDTGLKPEEYNHHFGEKGAAAMNNELHRRERKSSDDREFCGPIVFRNNNLTNRQPSKDVARVKNRTFDQTRKPELKAAVTGTSYKAPPVKSTEEGMSRKKLSTGAKSKIVTEMSKPFRVPRTNESRGSSHTEPQQSSLTPDFTERVKRESDVKMPVEIHKLEGRSSRPPRTDSVNSESPSTVRSTAPRSSKTKLPDQYTRAAASHPEGPVTHSASSNPQRTLSTVTSEGVRSNRGRARVHQGSSSESQPSSTYRAESPSAVRSTAPRSSKTKLPDRYSRAAASHPDGPVTHSASSNPRRTLSTVTSEGVRSNRGRARVHQGSSSESQPSSTYRAAPTKKTTKKKIV